MRISVGAKSLFDTPCLCRYKLCYFVAHYETTKMTQSNSHSRFRSSVQTARRVATAPAPSTMTSEEIKTFREEVLQVSQQVFAGVMNVAIQTVHAWEQGSRRPSGTALRLLHLARQQPTTLTKLIRQRPTAPAGGTGGKR